MGDAAVGALVVAGLFGCILAYCALCDWFATAGKEHPRRDID